MPRRRSGDPTFLLGIDWLAQDVVKRASASTFVDRLVREQDERPELLMNLLVDVANIDDFQHLARLEDGRSKVEKAQAAVAALKAVVAPYETSLKRQEQARAEIAARRVTSAESRASAQRLDELRATFVKISSLESRKRGYALEELLRDLFDAFELDPKASFKVVGEQIDGGFTLDTQHYIVEAKWEAGPADRADLDVLAAKVERRADNTLGLFVAYAGFKPTAIELHSARRSTLMLVDGADLYAVLEGRIDLRELLRVSAATPP